MKKERPEVLVIGGGATGAGIARDLAMRGADVFLTEAGDFASGASGANHGMLHSGARYAVKDPSSARECASECKVLKRIASFCIEDAGGTFVSLPSEDAEYPSCFLSACASTGVEAHEISVEEALKKEPNLNRDISMAVEVPDASVDPFFLVWGNVVSARKAGATVLNHGRSRISH
jgi:glycerol-3-phosphate dehydrogenase